MNMFGDDVFVLYAHVCVTGHKQAGMFLLEDFQEAF